MERVIFELGKLINIVLAAVLGGAIGFERKLRFKEAGIRTHTIVSVGAALIMVVSKFSFDGMNADASRVAAQIVSGISFLGAGIIMLRGQKMHGLTTAAGIWATAGVGMACGGELYIVAVGATIILIGVQCLMHSGLRIFKMKKYYTVKIKFRQKDGVGDRIKELFEVERFYRLSLERRGDETFYSATLHTDREFPSARLDEIMRENDCIDLIERCADE